MGTSSSLQEVAGKVGRIEDAVSGQALAGIVRRVGAKSKPIAQQAINPTSLSRWGRGSKRGGAKVAARYKVVSAHEVAIQPTVAPLAALLELGSYKAGGTWKAPKRRGSKRRKRVGTYYHGPVAARKAWSKSYPPVERAAPRFVDEEVQRVLRGIF